MRVFKAKSPTRVDLAGGTLDCWPLYLFLESPVTVNIGIDIFTSAELRPGADATIKLESVDQKVTKVYRNLESCLQCREPGLELMRQILRYYAPSKGFELSTDSQSPLGAGLGGSSSLCISILKVFNQWMGENFEINDLVRLASHIEARVLLKPTGTQDYFGALNGGLNFISYRVDGPHHSWQEIPEGLFKDRFCLVYTGKSHHSGINNWKVIKDWLDGDERTRTALRDLAAVSAAVESAVKNGRDSELNSLFEAEFEARVRLSSGFSSKEITKLSQLARANGAVAKICGAGGGGCVMIWSQEGRATFVAEKIREAGFEVLPAQPWTESGNI